MPYPKEIQHHSVKKKKKNHTSDEEEKARGQYTAMHSFPPDWMMNVKGITLCFACWLLYTYINIYSKKKRKKKSQVCVFAQCLSSQLVDLFSKKKKKLFSRFDCSNRFGGTSWTLLPTMKLVVLYPPLKKKEREKKNVKLKCVLFSSF